QACTEPGTAQRPTADSPGPRRRPQAWPVERRTVSRNASLGLVLPRGRGRLADCGPRIALPIPRAPLRGVVAIDSRPPERLHPYAPLTTADRLHIHVI